MPHPVFRAMSSAAASDAPQKQAYLVNHGSFNPAHAGHSGMMVKAKQRLEEAGWHVVGGCLAPASDKHVQQKMQKFKGHEALPLELRASACEAVCEGLEWLACDRRGAQYASGPWMGWQLLSEEQPTGVVVFSVIGADVAKKGVRKDFPHVVVARSGTKLTLTNTGEQNKHYVAEFEEDVDFHDFSSTSVRKAMLDGDWGKVTKMCGASAANLLRHHSDSHTPAEASAHSESRGKKRQRPE